MNKIIDHIITFQIMKLDKLKNTIPAINPTINLLRSQGYQLSKHNSILGSFLVNGCFSVVLRVNATIDYMEATDLLSPIDSLSF